MLQRPSTPRQRAESSSSRSPRNNDRDAPDQRDDVGCSAPNKLEPTPRRAASRLPPPPRCIVTRAARLSAHVGLTNLRADPRKPETRFAAGVGKGQDSNDALPLEVDHVIGEAADWPASRRHIIRNIQDTVADRRPTSDPIKGSVDSLDELDSKPGALLLVPESSVFEFGRGFRFWPEPPIHQSASRRRTRARTSSHGSPADSPDITRRARLSISRAQAASTSA